ncbi:MAG: DUF445 domain-containing protein [Syntrophomonadaceae bacterium]|jgi:uncharacterized membrane protein YheB (UPF0754 family)
MEYRFIAIPLISCLIGYITNVLAIKLLFWPQQPINLLFGQIQGLLPKRRSEIAAKIGELVQEQLVSSDDIIDKINTPEIRTRIVDIISREIREKLDTFLPGLMPAGLKQLIGDNLDKILYHEVPAFIDQVINADKGFLNNQIQINQMVEDRINAFNLRTLEDMIRNVSATELKFIEILGGVLGFIIGLLQVGMLVLLPI